MHKRLTLAAVSILVFSFTSYTQQAAGNFASQQKLLSPFLPDSILVIADTGFQKAGTKRWLLGDHYRKEWITPVKVPVVLLDTLFGGVTVLREGGGNQTRSLRLSIDSAAKKEMVIRSIEKFPDKAIAADLTGGAISDLVKDQISTAHPFGAIVVPPLAEAANVYHTNPKIVFIASSPKLSSHDKVFGNRLYLLEERPRSDWSNTLVFGGSEKVINTDKLVEKLLQHSTNVVDVPAYLRARLLDMLIGDWDRHEDQWDWAGFQSGEETIYRPVPKDRDQAFVKVDGVAPWISTRKWLLRRVQNFNYKINDVDGLNWAARNLDRFLLNGLSWSKWEQEIRFVQSAWADTVIKNAVANLPPELYKLSGEEIGNKMLQRRQDLYKYARHFYLSLAKSVNWTGTDDRDEFMVDLQSDTLVVIEQYSFKNGMAELVKKRDFHSQETKEIQLYGQNENDVFKVKGTGNPSVKIRWIGGEGKDEFVISEPKKDHYRIRIYDTVDNRRYYRRSFKLRERFDNSTHQYNYDAFNYSRLTPLFLFAYNVDDGVAVGLGLKWQKTAWGYRGFSQEHFFNSYYAFRTGAYQFSYGGLFKKAIREWDLFLRGDVRQPAYILNFYGPGNETQRTETDRNYYNVRVRQIEAAVGVQRQFREKHNLQLATEFLTGKVESDENRFVKIGNPLFDSTDFERMTWLGVSGAYLFSTRNNIFFPTKGINWTVSTNYNRGINNNDWWASAGSSFSLYFPLGPLVVASRIGGASVWGQPQFFQLSHLSGLENLRGFRRTRYSGKSLFYYNQELRLPVKDLTGYIFRGRIGLLAFSDQGRVWYPGESSSAWHWGYGGGIWYIPYGRISFSLTYTQSKEDRLVVIRSGFLF